MCEIKKDNSSVEISKETYYHIFDEAKESRDFTVARRNNTRIVRFSKYISELNQHLTFKLICIRYEFPPKIRFKYYLELVTSDEFEVDGCKVLECVLGIFRRGCLNGTKENQSTTRNRG